VFVFFPRATHTQEDAIFAKHGDKGKTGWGMGKTVWRGKGAAISVV
jgi:hypothetical protein